MPESDDVIQIRWAIPECGWVMGGGATGDDGVSLHFSTETGRFEVDLPISLDADGRLTVGTPEVREL